MGAYRLRDLLLPPSLVSALRLPLAVAFPFAGGEPAAGIALLVAAGTTDVIDGWLARRFGWVTATGGVVDGVTDKLFAGTVVGSLLVWGHLAPADAALLATREMLELPLVLWLAASPRARRAREKSSMANLPGKAATVLQFAAVAAALALPGAKEPLLFATSATGAWAALRYWRRAMAEHAAEREHT